jgi:hypothetical protein
LGESDKQTQVAKSSSTEANDANFEVAKECRAPAGQ